MGMDYSSDVFYCRGTEEVFQALEDNQVALSTMKASHFVKAFEKDVDHWERCLSLILEVVEMVLTVQRQWMYLEVRTPCLSCSCKPPLLLSLHMTYILALLAMFSHLSSHFFPGPKCLSLSDDLSGSVPSLSSQP